MTKIFDVSTIVAALDKAREDLLKANTYYVIAELNEAQAHAILGLVGECTEHGEAMVAGISSEEIRRDAYHIATRSSKDFVSSPRELHDLAANIADNIENGFATPKGSAETVATGSAAPKTTDTVTLEIGVNVDTSEVDAAEARINEVMERITKRTAEFDNVVAGIFERTEWRREAWNDCKAVMIREVTKQLNHRTAGGILCTFSYTGLGKIRDFIASFQFDESKP